LSFNLFINKKSSKDTKDYMKTTRNLN